MTPRERERLDFKEICEGGNGLYRKILKHDRERVPIGPICTYIHVTGFYSNFFTTLQDSDTNCWGVKLNHGDVELKLFGI